MSEAEAILNHKIHGHEDIEITAQELLSLGVKSVLIKSEHDYFSKGSQSFWLSSQRYQQKIIAVQAVFSSAITA